MAGIDEWRRKIFGPILNKEHVRLVWNDFFLQLASNAMLKNR